ncbi:DUF4157 domain-containing protein [Ascidiimonas aurantiaca]|uniref:eCIS core domain-containing protein n=1 Tax=Ascidiimonas aurantiaca TaxID=1685432 RepID=UPI0030EE605D
MRIPFEKTEPRTNPALSKTSDLQQKQVSAHNFPKNALQHKLYGYANTSDRVLQLKTVQGMANSSVQSRQMQQWATKAHIYAEQRNLPVQPKTNQTGLPDQLKTGIESLSGYAMDDVKVHYHSAKPAQLQAHAYTRGTNIYVAPGQEKHLPHETWHVVQQKQGRVQPTLQLKGKIPVNDDPGLEKEADIMGARALSATSTLQTLQTAGQSFGSQLTVQRVGLGGWLSSYYGDGMKKEEGQPDMPVSNSRRIWGGWLDSGISLAKNWYGRHDPEKHPEGLAPHDLENEETLEAFEARKKSWESGERRKGKAAGAAGGLLGSLGGIFPNLGYDAYTLWPAAKGLHKHTKNAMDLADKDVEDVPESNSWYGVLGRKAQSLGTSVLSPVIRGVGSAFKQQGNNEEKSPKYGAMGDTFHWMSDKGDGTEGSGWDKFGALLHTGIGTLAQLGVGTATGIMKSGKNITDYVAGKIGPGPISSVTGPFMLHQGLEAGGMTGDTLKKIQEAIDGNKTDTGKVEKIDELLKSHEKDGKVSTTLGEIGSSLDQAGALSQVVSGAMNIPSALLNYIYADKSTPVKKGVAKHSGLEQGKEAASNLLRGGFFAATDIAKGDEATKTSQWLGLTKLFGTSGSKAGTTASALGYTSTGIYSAYHLWKAGWAGKAWYDLNKVKNAAHTDDHMNSMDDNVPSPVTPTDKFLNYATDKKKSAFYRNSLALAGTGAALLGGAGVATAIGLGLGGVQLWHWLSSKKGGSERQRKATWLVNQYMDHAKYTNNAHIANIGKALIPSDLRKLMDNVRQQRHGNVQDPNPDFVDPDHGNKLRDEAITAVENELSSW